MYHKNSDFPNRFGIAGMILTGDRIGRGSPASVWSRNHSTAVNNGVLAHLLVNECLAEIGKTFVVFGKTAHFSYLVI